MSSISGANIIYWSVSSSSRRGGDEVDVVICFTLYDMIICCKIQVIINPMHLIIFHDDMNPGADTFVHQLQGEQGPGGHSCGGSSSRHFYNLLKL